MMLGMQRRHISSPGKKRFQIDSEATFGAKTNRMVKYYHLSVCLTLVLVSIATCLVLYGTYDREAAAPVLSISRDILSGVDRIGESSLVIATQPTLSDANTHLNTILQQQAAISENIQALEKYISSTWAVNRHPSVQSTLADLNMSFRAVSTDTIELKEISRSSKEPAALRYGADRIHESAVKLAMAASNIGDASALARDEASRSRSFTVLALVALILIVGVVQNFVIFKSIKRSFEKRGLDLVNHKEQAEAQLQELLARSEILRERQTEYEEKIAEQQINADHVRRALDRMRELVTSLPIASIGTDVEGTVYEWNSAAEKTFGYPAYEVLHQPLSDLVINPEDRESFQKRLLEAVTRDKPVNFQLPGLRKGSQLTTLEWSLMPMRGANGEVSGITITAHDVSESIRKQERLAELAFKDALTGLHNRRSFFVELEGAYPAVSQYSPLSVVLLDVDKFKVYNDTYGHSAGDAVLQRVGEVMRLVSPTHATPGRYGGEEFVMLLPKTSEEEAFAFAEVVREQIALSTQDLHFVTASLGIATTRDPEFPSKELIDRADRALYVSKHEGRNRSTLWTPAVDEQKAA